MMLYLSVGVVVVFVLGVPFWSCLTGAIMVWEMGVFSPAGFFLSILLDPVGLAFGFVMTFVASQVYAYSLGYMRELGGLVFFYCPLYVFVFSMWVLIFVPDLLCMFLAWDGLGVSSFLLVLFYSSSQAAGGSVITVMTNRFGDGFFLLGLCGQMEDFNMFSFSLSPGVSSSLFGLAAFSKSAQWPLSAWLPSAMAAPTPISSLVHSSTLVTAGVFLVLRLEGGIGDLFEDFLWVPGLTLFLASFSACLSYDLKRIVAMSTLGHLSLLFISLMVGSGGLTVYHLLTHALFKSLLFMSAGNAIVVFGHSQDIRDMGSMLKSAPLTGGCMMLSLSSLGGLPFTSGFYSKDLIFEAMGVNLNIEGGIGFSLLAFLSLPLSVGYSLRVWFYLVSGYFTYPAHAGAESNRALVAPLASLSVACVVIGPVLCCLFPLYDTGFSSQAGCLYWVSVAGVIIGFLREELPLLEKMRDFQGSSSMCFVRAPCHLVSSGVLGGSLAYTKHIEHGWLEYVGPQGLVKLGKSLARISKRYEW